MESSVHASLGDARRRLGLRTQVLLVLVGSLGAGFGWAAYSLARLAERVGVWAELTSGARSHLGGLIFLYTGFAGALAIIVTYALLTYVTVRPLERLRIAVASLGSGQRAHAVPVRGAAEVASLAQVYNHLLIELRSERSAREARLRELEATTNELRLARSQVERSARLAAVGRLAAGVAHEVGNPLAAVLGLLELMRTAELPPEQVQEFLRRIEAETERMHRTIRDLLDFSRQGAEEEQDAEQVDLCAVVNSAVGLVAPQKDLRDITIVKHYESEPSFVRGSADRLTQLVLNLILNAADVLDGHGEISLHLRECECANSFSDNNHASRSSTGWILLEVKDSGPGVPDDMVEDIFEPFVTTKAAGEGTGLGLAVCRTIVEAYGGSIRARGRSNADGGCFEVMLQKCAS